ncbi:SOUL family heme-binding protein [Falsiroseomonas sp. E2-1-a20]|uniref:SOUL family heme-binding protein n=1 Tax=Falsiroseomonas sp. E2-1-a20 TaxID=3239300 RepID=UPI003F322538
MLERLAAGATALAQGVASVAGVRTGTEEPPFEVLDRARGLEIRRYAVRLAAETEVPADETASRSEGFSRLARYIFGGNQARARIAMTAPVDQARARAGHRIRFFLPAALKEPPVPADPRVQIVQVPPETCAVLRFSGSTAPQCVADAKARLLAALKDTAWVAEGAPIAWFYDPPWTIPALRRIEVAVPVRRRD